SAWSSPADGQGVGVGVGVGVGLAVDLAVSVGRGSCLGGSEDVTGGTITGSFCRTVDFGEAGRLVDDMSGGVALDVLRTSWIGASTTRWRSSGTTITTVPATSTALAAAAPARHQNRLREARRSIFARMTPSPSGEGTTESASARRARRSSSPYSS